MNTTIIVSFTLPLMVLSTIISLNSPKQEAVLISSKYALRERERERGRKEDRRERTLVLAHSVHQFKLTVTEGTLSCCGLLAAS